MLDRYVWGDAERISQEAPGHPAARRPARGTPRRRQQRRHHAARPRRAASRWPASSAPTPTAAASARCSPIWASTTKAVVTDPDRPSTVKERYIGRAQHRHPQQMIRVDYEVARAVCERCRSRLDARRSRGQLRTADIVLISDYDKGVCTPGLLAAIIAAARAQRPAHARRPDSRQRLSQVSRLLGDHAQSPGSGPGHRPRPRRHGTRRWPRPPSCANSSTSKRPSSRSTRTAWPWPTATAGAKLFPTRPRQVYDITGAGDMVLTVLGMALAAGADYEPAIRLANVAGGLEVEKIGVATVTRDEILRDLLHGVPGRSESVRHWTKCCAPKRCSRSCDGRRAPRSARRLHQRLLRRAARRPRAVSAGGPRPGRPARRRPQQRRQRPRAQGTEPAGQLRRGPRARAGRPCRRSIIVTVFDEPTPLELIEALRPDVLVKGADYRREDVVGAEFVESYGGRVHLAPLRDGHSTTRLLQRLGAA